MTKHASPITRLPLILVTKISLVLLLACLAAASRPLSAPKFKLLVFEGSDWCTNCWRLEKNILSDSVFISRSAEMGIEVERIDFPQRKKLSDEVRIHNESVATQYNFDGSFPTLLLARVDTFLFQKIRYSNQGTDEFLQEIAARKSALE
ncbi:MAG: hypothetical protein IT258_20650 [Saprospiraceae bacterium]|nr:hypothetical protein [Saprospiraceae bacterium]